MQKKACKPLNIGLHALIVKFREIYFSLSISSRILDEIRNPCSSNLSITGSSSLIKPRCFALNNTPQVPVILNPKRSASFLPFKSSIINRTSGKSIARAIAEDSPLSNIASNRN